MKLIAILVVLFTCAVGRAQFNITADSQRPDEQFVVPAVFSGNTPFMRMYYFDDGAAFTLTNWTMAFLYSYGQYDTNSMFQITGTTASNCATFVSGTNVFVRSGNYYFSIRGTTAAGYIKTFAVGKMICKYDPATSPGATNTPGANGLYWVTTNDYKGWWNTTNSLGQYWPY